MVTDKNFRFSFPVGVANSVSANFEFDPLDAINFARHYQFSDVQIYLTSAMLEDPALLSRLAEEEKHFQRMYFHVEGRLNVAFLNSTNFTTLVERLQTFQFPNFIIHFDEQCNLAALVGAVEKIKSVKVQIYLENYFAKSGRDAAEKNLRKFLALFTLVNSTGLVLYPVLDIPRLFHQKLKLSKRESIEWTYQLFNFFGNKKIPALLHVIDTRDDRQIRSQYCPLGEGSIPYAEIFDFLRQTRPPVEGIILEYEDKISPLKSREFLRQEFSR